MSFFEQQAQSRKRTLLLLGYFILAIGLIAVAVYGLLMAILFYDASKARDFKAASFVWLHPKWLLLTSAFVFGIIAIGSVYKIIALARGGEYVAESLGGRLVNRAQGGLDEEKLLNVVEEMALASGVPAPKVYVLEKEKGINAFAAGYSLSDAVIAVTRGCLDQLNRDELQGVIAHEYSHILNGDMRLNLRIIGLVSGVMIIASIGYMVIRGADGDSKDSWAVLCAGLALVIIGYFGVMTGNIIQSAVSRQREYLADASAVQFTRNPHGIAGALRKIAAFDRGSKIKSPEAPTASHMFFSTAVWSLFATHPPIEQRIKLIESSFDWDQATRESAGDDAAGSEAAFQPMPGWQPLSGGQPASGFAGGFGAAVQSVGTMSPGAIAHGAGILSMIPEELRQDVGFPLGAAAIVCCLLLDGDPAKRDRRNLALVEVASTPLMHEVFRQTPRLTAIEQRYRLPLIDLAMPALTHLSKDQYENLESCIDVLAPLDQGLSLFDFSIRTIVKRRLAAVHDRASKLRERASRSRVRDDMIALLSKLAYSGQDNPEKAAEAFANSAPALEGAPESLAILPEAKTNYTLLDAALTRLATAPIKVRKVVLEACSRCVLYDKVVTIEEAELLRALAYSLDLPLPPILETA